jgi:hypothetical protein
VLLSIRNIQKYEFMIGRSPFIIYKDSFKIFVNVFSKKKIIIFYIYIEYFLQKCNYFLKYFIFYNFFLFVCVFLICKDIFVFLKKI